MADVGRRGEAAGATAPIARAEAAVNRAARWPTPSDPTSSASGDIPDITFSCAITFPRDLGTRAIPVNPCRDRQSRPAPPAQRLRGARARGACRVININSKTYPKQQTIRASRFQPTPAACARAPRAAAEAERKYEAPDHGATAAPVAQYSPDRAGGKGEGGWAARLSKASAPTAVEAWRGNGQAPSGDEHGARGPGARPDNG